jgi:hypothetical protein
MDSTAKDWNMAAELTTRQSHYIAEREDASMSGAHDGETSVWITSWTTFCCSVHKPYNLRAFPFDVQYLPLRIEVSRPFS